MVLRGKSGRNRAPGSGGLLALAALAVASAGLAEVTAIRLAERETLASTELAPAGNVAAPSHRLDLAVVHFADGPWPRAEVLGLTAAAAALLAPCGVWLGRVERLRVAAPERFHYLHTPESRALAQALRPPRPTLYFVTDTRQQPAFDAEAIGRGNSRTRPELRDSVWLTRPARDPALALAHELAHVLLDSGAHVTTPGNLMRDQTAPGSTALDPAQCAALRSEGTRNGLLHAARPPPAAPGPESYREGSAR
ncbi:MAG TPA: hypothetical protein VIW02_00240 [Gammaproteobacteria bacterium]